MTDDGMHCGNDCGGTYGDGEFIDDPVDCVCCECCCTCLGCEYGPRNGMPMTAEQRAPIAAMAFHCLDAPPNAGSSS